MTQGMHADFKIVESFVLAPLVVSPGMNLIKTGALLVVKIDGSLLKLYLHQQDFTSEVLNIKPNDGEHQAWKLFESILDMD